MTGPPRDYLGHPRDVYSRPADAPMVTVSFETRADVMNEEMTAEDWIAIGKAVADIAVQVRAEAA